MVSDKTMKQIEGEILSKGFWEDLVGYEKTHQIFTAYPYPIRKKSTMRVLKEQTNCDYIQVYLCGHTRRKHRLIALQFVPNPDHLPYVDHINRNKHDNHIENLRWVTARENQLNKEQYKRVQDDVYLDALPEGCIKISEYNGYKFDKYWFDPKEERIIAVQKNGKIKVLCKTLNNRLYKFDLRDAEGKKRGFRWNKFLNSMKELCNE